MNFIVYIHRVTGDIDDSNLYYVEPIALQAKDKLQATLYARNILLPISAKQKYEEDFYISDHYAIDPNYIAILNSYACHLVEVEINNITNYTY